MAIVYGPQAFTVSSDTPIDQFPSAGSPDFAYNAGSGTDLSVNAADDRVDSTTLYTELAARCLAAGIPTGDQEVQATVYAGGSSSHGMLWVRLNTSGPLDGYAAYVDLNTLIITRYTNGSGNWLISTSQSLPAGANTLRLKVTGTNPVVLEAQLNANAVVTYSDSSAGRKTAGPPGLGLFTYTAHVAFVDNFQVDDLITGPVVKSASDTLRPIVTEARSLLSRSTRSDTVRPGLSEASSLVDRASSAETCLPILSEARTLVSRSAPTDSLRPVLTEASSLLVRLSASDTVRPGISEANTLISRTSTSDILRTVMSEATGLAARSTPVESLVPGLSEQVSVRGLLSVTDLLQPRVAPETASLAGAFARSGSDTLRPVVSEAPAALFQVETKLAVDSLTPVLGEARTLAARSNRGESSTVLLTEASQLIVRSTQADSLTPVVSEQSGVFIPVVTIPQAAADSTRPLLGELASLVVHLSTSDLLRPSLAEITVSAVRSSPGDLLRPVIGEALNLRGRTVALDTLTPILTDALGSVVAIISLSASDELVPLGMEAPTQLIILAPPPIGLIRLGQVQLTPAGRTTQLTLKPAAKAAVEVTHAALSDPRTD